ncbi:MAG: bifunctional riboflavin kinase/FAD synthetase [Verrucomicrobiae bacterium]|nr:bifunctional riboflavin kinase/FAD synthetase [Verrucomicrobiae bacterium]
MQVVSKPSELKCCGGKLAATLGMFDGVHLGHQQIIQHALSDAKHVGGSALVITFDRHPETVVAPARAPLLIQPLWHKLRAFESLGVQYVWLIEFNYEFSRIRGEDFIRNLVSDIGGLYSICVGADFVFGHGQSGNLQLLKTLGAELGFAVRGIGPVLVDGQPVSSTRIRKAISEGDFATAGRLLGRPYALAGCVIRGQGLGRTIGFPTANLDTAGLVLPPNGVYAARARLRARTYPAAVNVGYRPTVSSAQQTRTVEAYLLDATGDFYGEQIELEFVCKLRDEVAFPSLQALQCQIAADVNAVRKIFSSAATA